MTETPPGWDGLPLTPKHAAYLESHAILPHVARTAGVRSVATAGDLPNGHPGWWVRLLPGLLYEWCFRDVIEHQLATDDRSDPAVPKYAFRNGASGVINEAAVPADGKPILLVEGTKQHLAAASYAPDGIGVFGIAGCWGWSKVDLSFLEGRDVVVIFDADVATNRGVYDAARKLVSALETDGVASVKFVTLPTGGKDGLDDLLGRRPHEKRAATLARLLASAGDPPKRAPAKEAKGARGEDHDVEVEIIGEAPNDPLRPKIELNADRWHVMGNILQALRRHDGVTLFNHGGAFSQLDGDQLERLDKDLLGVLVQESARTSYNHPEYGPQWRLPEAALLGMCMKRTKGFTQLDRIAKAPFVRPDGTICQEGGYDKETRTLLLLDPSLGPVDVPEHPQPEQVAAALAYIREECLVDFLKDMPTAADKANALALLLTPHVRGLMRLAPLAIVDGLQAGVAKGKLAEVVSTVAIGKISSPLPYSRDDAEQRKVLTSTFRAGASILVFDEAHVIEGASFARALTATTWTDRILGVSLLTAEIPNQVTMISLGNKVVVIDDMQRRGYRIAIWPTGENPQFRPASSFRHPQPEWTEEHRAEMLTAVLTLIRNWFSKGKPWTPRGGSLGSYETWERTVGGILQAAGVEGFLDNIQVLQVESDHDRAYWMDHYGWLLKHFPEGCHTNEAARQALDHLPDFEAPPGLDDPTAKGYSRLLGQAYARQRDKILDGLKLVRLDGARSHGHKWRVVKATGTDSTGHPTEGASGATESAETAKDDLDGATNSAASHPMGWADGATVQPDVLEMMDGTCSVPQLSHVHPCYSGRHGAPVAPLHRPTPHPMGGAVVAVDLETCDKAQRWRRHDFVRLAGYSVDGGLACITTDIAGLVDLLQGAEHVVGHNLLGFDLLALAHHHGLDLRSLTDRGAVVDTKLLAFLADPPPARMNAGQIEKRYSLNAVSHRLLGETKQGDLKALAKEFGGHDHIPIDDPRFLGYLTGDVQLTRRLAERLLPMTDYARREHWVAAIAAQVSLNGFRIDLDLLEQRLTAGRERKANLLEQLQREYGLPTARKDGKPSLSPQSTEAGRAAIRAAFEAAGVLHMPTTAAGTWATGRVAMDVMAERHADNPAAVELIQLVKDLNGIRSVYQTVDEHRVGDRVHPSVEMRQASGRWSLTKPGLTVLGKRGGKYAERDIFLPEEDHVIVTADLAQIDARAIAALSQDEAYLELFGPGGDVHRRVAEQVWGDPGRREDAKAVAHGWNYGQGIRGLVRTAEVPEHVAQQFDRAMRERFGRLVEWRDRVRERAAAGELLDNGFGRLMRPDPNRSWTQGPALMGQGAARDLLVEGLLRLPREVLPMLRAVVHDEVVLSVPREQAEDVERVVLEALSFSWAPPGCALAVEVVAKVGQRGSSWGACYEE